MCGFTFTVFVSEFQLLPAAPFRILEMGGSTFASGLFLGFLTYASAFSAPFTGSIADRIGRRKTLLIASAVATACAIGYALAPHYQWLLVLVVIHGVFWSALLSASSAYLTSLLPERRRAEGIGYWGLSSIAAVAVAPPLAFWLMRHGGWAAVCYVCAGLNVLMGAIAWTIEEPPHAVPAANGTAHHKPLLESRVLALSLTLFLYTFGYGAITSFSAVYADAIGVSPKGIYLTTLAVIILLTRPLSASLADRVGYRRVFVPCLGFITAGLAALAVLRGSRASLIASAIIFGLGFGTAYPVFVAYVMRDVHARRRGAAFGAILAAFDTGIGTGSTVVGWLIQRFDFATAFGAAAALSALAMPYFLIVDRRQRSAAPR